jgi:anthranilate synthase component 2
MQIAIIDNYDSFVFNLVRYIGENDAVQQTVVMRNDEIDYDVLAKADGILLSPGPGIPSEAGDLLKVIDQFGERKSILGVCLGHQAIAEYYGGTIEIAPEIIHGKSSEIQTDTSNFLFKSLNNKLTVGRYHSWQVNASLPDSLECIANFGEQVMGLAHKTRKNYGIQFHPESVLTPEGRTIINNWIVSCKQH